MPVASKSSPVPEESILTASIARKPSSVLKISTLANPFVDNKYAHSVPNTYFVLLGLMIMAVGAS